MGDNLWRCMQPTGHYLFTWLPPGTLDYRPGLQPMDQKWTKSLWDELGPYGTPTLIHDQHRLAALALRLSAESP